MSTVQKHTLLLLAAAGGAGVLLCCLSVAASFGQSLAQDGEPLRAAASQAAEPTSVGIESVARLAPVLPVSPAARVQVRDTADVRVEPRASLVFVQIEGRALASDGSPVSGVELAAGCALAQSSTSDADGRFRVMGRTRSDEIKCLTPGYVVHEPTIRAESALLEQRASDEVVRTIVVDTERPIWLEVSDAETLRPLHATRVTYRDRVATTSETGVEIVGIGVNASVQVRCERPGYQAATIEITPGERRAELVLHALDSSRLRRGVVIAADGDPVAGAHVASGAHRTRTGARGQFALPEGDDSIRAFHRALGEGLAAAGETKVHLIARPASDGQGQSPSNMPITLEVAGRPAAFARVVPVDVNGAPDVLAPFWMTARADELGRVTLPVSSSTSTAVDLVAVDKGGREIARFERSSSGK